MKICSVMRESVMRKSIKFKSRQGLRCSCASCKLGNYLGVITAVSSLYVLLGKCIIFDNTARVSFVRLSVVCTWMEEETRSFWSICQPHCFNGQNIRKAENEGKLKSNLGSFIRVKYLLETAKTRRKLLTSIDFS